MTAITADPLVTAAQLLLGGVFLLSAVAKIRAPRDFVRGALSFAVATPWVVRPFAWLLPWIEGALAVSLLTRLAGRLAAVAALPLLQSLRPRSSW